MARPSAPGSSSGTIAATTTMLLLALQLLLLPAPASSRAGLVVKVFPFIKKFGRIPSKEVATAGGRALIKQSLRSSDAGGHVNLLGAAAADDAGIIVYDFSIGPAQQSFSGVVDLLSNFIWVQCPAAATFSRIPCASDTCKGALNFTDDSHCSGDCEYYYGSAVSGTNTTGYLVNETLTVGGNGTTTAAPPITGSALFGCSSILPPDNETGIIGFSKGHLSILSQLDISRFSYFVTPDDSNSSDSTSVVLLGDQAVPLSKHSRSTPLLQSDAYPAVYYVKLTSIQVEDETLTGIPAGAFNLSPNGSSGGVVLSTTNDLTWLQKDAYDAVRKALVKRIMSAPVNSSGTDLDVFDLCYDMQSVAHLTFPKITLVFDGQDSPVMELTTVHYFYKDVITGLQCLTMLPTDAGEPSILGIMMQAGTNMIYDVAGGHLTFDKGAAVPSKVSLMVIATSLVIVCLCHF